MVQQKLVSSEKTNEKENICRDEPELRFPEFKDKWKKEKIGEISKTYSGGTPSTSNKNFYIGNIPFIKSGEINSEETEQYINEDAINNSSAKLVKKGDLLLALYGATSGEVAISKLDGAINQAVLKIDNEMDNVFQYNYFLKEKENIVHKYLQGGQGNLSSKIIKNLELYYPNINEQKKIANFLLTIDKKIELLEKKCDFLKEYKTGFIQKLRKGEINFKKDNKNYPKWEEIPLKDILYEHKLKSTGNEEVYSVSVHKGVVNQIEHLGRSFATDDLSKYKLVKPGDIIYTKSPTAGFELGIIKQNKNDKNVLVSPLYGVFTPKNTYLGNYIDAYFESSINTRNYLHPIVQKGAKNTMNISNKVFLSRSLLLPVDFEEQKKISDYINLINQKYEDSYNLCENIKLIKKGLLQKMFI